MNAVTLTVPTGAAVGAGATVPEEVVAGADVMGEAVVGAAVEAAADVVGETVGQGLLLLRLLPRLPR